MDLKDAFRFQNKLESLMDEACGILQDRRNILKVRTTHLRSQVSPEEKDVEVEELCPSDYAGQATALAAFLMAMLAEREKLSAAIRGAKAGLDIDRLPVRREGHTRRRHGLPVQQRRQPGDLPVRRQGGHHHRL